MVKIKETYQEVVSEGETSQEGMDAPIDDTTAQKIFKAIKEQNDVLKKMGGHLTKLEETKLKKSIRVDIHDEDEDWDESDKAEYERNKQFEKLTVDTVAIKEKMEKCNWPFARPKGWIIVSTIWVA